jgi:hypothetical protein
MDGFRTIVGLILLGCLAFGLRLCAVLASSPDRAAPTLTIAAAAGKSPSESPSESPSRPPSESPSGFVSGGHEPPGSGLRRAAQLLQCLVGTATVLAIAWLGWLLVREQRAIGWMAALGLAVYPPQVNAAAYPQAAVWATLALCCLTAVVMSPRWPSTRAGAVLAGCLAGVVVVLEPVLVLAAAICAAVFWRDAGRHDQDEPPRRPAFGQLAILAGVAVAVLGCWYAGDWLWGGAASPSPAGAERACLERLRDFLLSSVAGPAHDAGRLERFATIACLVLALMGGCISWHRWRTLWPTYAIVAAIVLSDAWDVIPATSRLSIEPIGLLWAALAVGPPLARVFAGRRVRVYRPGERAEDPLERAHLLRGPHYDVGVRRRAG